MVAAVERAPSDSSAGTGRAREGAKLQIEEVEEVDEEEEEHKFSSVGRTGSAEQCAPSCDSDQDEEQTRVFKLVRAEVRELEQRDLEEQVGRKFSPTQLTSSCVYISLARLSKLCSTCAVRQDEHADDTDDENSPPPPKVHQAKGITSGVGLQRTFPCVK